MTDKELIQAARTCQQTRGCGHCTPFNECPGRAAYLAMITDRLEAMLAENECLREVTKTDPKWVSVKERLPELSFSEYNKIERCGYTGAPEFLVQIVGARQATALHYDGENWFDEECAAYLVEYWAELPRIPAADQLCLPITQH